ncbi:MAG: hypothetical protein JJ926_15960 [Roseitalea sp.]|jgi:hypothetical protein|uniref:Uncharacterized protein n=1 Tax=Oceaniradius stylonematis TaxID=2184161 RepID=A0A3A8AAQ9_9HYPH|nr:hypothetical protein [Oceaniradius stylonematis]MBO6554071.1 hypothetical protein [Roseitalea sp.]MBO6952805.1 hypothetical protein [Rhizobiaceae bacterium]RNC96739.1 MAG: hypothetical protein ED558_02405 [Oricola sp.]MBO6593152.1 hypothetical protein [Roseitalea sp.]MBO6600858.1 hypothetical protein [Roseitalea sp.]
MNFNLIAQLTFAGALIGFLIGPNSLDEFIGIIPNNPVPMNIFGGALIGAALGVLGSLTKEIE